MSRNEKIPLEFGVWETKHVSPGNLWCFERDWYIHIVLAFNTTIEIRVWNDRLSDGLTLRVEASDFLDALGLLMVQDDTKPSDKE